MNKRLVVVTLLSLTFLALSSAGFASGESQKVAIQPETALVPEAGRTSQSITHSIAQTAPRVPTACSVPVTQNLRGKDVDLDQCYEFNFTHDSTAYTVHVFYTEVDTATNLSRCTSDDYAGRCEHKLADGDDGSGNNLIAVAIAQEAEKAMKFYHDRNLPFLWSGTTLSVFIAEDPRGGGTPTCNSILVDDEWIDNNDVLSKRLLAFHEMQHLIQCHYQPTPGWDGFYGEGIARAIEDRVDTTLDADTGHLFIPEMNGILGNNDLRTSDLTTYSYPTALWWTWLLDQYRTGGETAPVLGWQALRNFYLGVPGATSTLSALKNFISSQGSSFRLDFTDYTLAMYAYRYTNSTPRLDFLDAEINSNGNPLSGHTVVSSGPAFSTSSFSANPRSSTYWEYTPASQCDFIGFEFDGKSKDYSFSVMTVNSGGILDKRWSSYGDTYARTVGTAGLSRVVGVVTAIDENGTVDVGRGCVTPNLEIKNPTTALFEMVGEAANPRNFIVRLDVSGPGGGPVTGLLASDFQVQLRKTGTSTWLDALILSSTYVQDDYWLLVSPPDDSDGAETGQFYDLIARLGSHNHTQNSAVLYVPRAQDVVVVLDRSGSMGGSTGRIQAARNAAAMLVNELADTDQGAFVAFDTDAELREPLNQVSSGATSHRQKLIDAIAAEAPLDYTSIGDGLKTAADEHDLHKNADHMCSFVLLSDGYENEPEYWNDIKGQVIDNGCPLHVIGLGPEAHETLLQLIAGAVPGGSYDFADSAGTVSSIVASPTAPTLSWANNLHRIYDFKAAQIGGRQRIQATMGEAEQGEAFYEFFVDETASKLVISIGWQSPSSSQDVELLDPDGNPIPPYIPDTNSPAAPYAVRRIQPTNEVWEVFDLVPGKYTLVVRELFQEHFIGLSSESLYQMYLFIGTPIQDLLQGVQVPLFVTFVTPDRPLIGADVTATVRDPAGILRSLTLFDDGNHLDGEPDDGVYGALYSITSMADTEAEKPTEGEEPETIGSYLVNVVGIKDELRREAQGSFAIQQDKDENGNRLPDGWEARYGVSDPEGDPDGDTLNNYCESQAGTDPLNSDTDGGGESDGSEAPNCYVDPNFQDPFDPSDDRTGPLPGVFVVPELDLGQRVPFLRVWWDDPHPGDLLFANVYRLTHLPDTFESLQPSAEEWELVAQGIDDYHFNDYGVAPGNSYQYRIVPFVESGRDTVQGGAAQTSPVSPSNDPYPPGGSVLINNGDASTTSTHVLLTISADDLYGGQDGEPPVEIVSGNQPTSLQQPGTPAAELMMRISNSADFSQADWIPFQTEFEWDLGDLMPKSIATVYIQFMDEAGNISQSGFGGTDTILYDPPALYLPLLFR